MAEFQVTCINKNDRFNPYERITDVGIVTDQGTLRKTQKEIISYIEEGHTFYVQAGGVKAYLEIAISPFDNKYIKTKADGKEPNNLLSLDECRWA